MAVEEHSSPIKTPQQLITVMVLSFVVPVLALIMLAYLVFTNFKIGGDSGMTDEDIRARIKPVAQVSLDLTGGSAAAGAGAPRMGEAVYTTVCAACHNTGAAGAPKKGDKAAWSTRLSGGLDHLVETVIKGQGAMPPKGGGADLSELEIARAVVYLANASGGSFKEPAAPATAAAAPAKPAERSGEEIVKAACGTCHQTGEGGAPKIGDRAAWSKRISGGMDRVIASAIRGHGGMPARGGLADLTDPEVRKAIEYMFSASGAPLGSAAAPAPAPAAAPAAAAASTADKGKAVYDQACMACHATGAAGAPKLGDKAAWAPRIALGMETLYADAIKGKGAMPPKGGRTDIADADIKAAVDYMVAASR